VIPRKFWWFKEYETLPNLWQDNGESLIIVYCKMMEHITKGNDCASEELLDQGLCTHVSDPSTGCHSHDECSLFFATFCFCVLLLMQIEEQIVSRPGNEGRDDSSTL